MKTALTLSLAAAGLMLALGGAGCLEVSRPAAVTPGGEPDAAVTTDTAGGVDAGAPDTWSPVCGQCGDGNPCTEDLCDEATGQCVNDPVANGTSCGMCGAVCVEGTCTTASNAVGEVPGCAMDADCDDGDPCTTDVCHEDCTCSQTPIPDCGGGCGGAQGGCASAADCPQPGAMCAYAWCDLATCTCQIAQEPNCGGCPGGCDDANPCTQDSCDFATATCVHAPGPANGAPCGVCGAVCSDGLCVGPPVMPICDTNVDCDDGDPCTQDVCVDQCSCEHVAIPGCGICDSCFDGNACTNDVCTAAGDCAFPPVADGTPCGECGVCSAGQCLGMGMAACASDADCDDGNACTTDVCNNCMCYSTVTPNCGTPCSTHTDCDDGDPCTADSCAGGVCNSVDDGSCAPPPVCNSQGVRPVSQFLWGPAGQAVKVAGVPQVANAYTCTAAVCDPSNPCCNSCMGDTQIVDVGWGVLSSPTDDFEPGWTCSSDSCGTTTSCQPPHHDTAYWVWGTTYEHFGGPLFVVAAPSVALGVEGWCVQTTPAGLPGVWLGQVTLMDAMTGIATSYEVQLTISIAAGGWSMVLEPTTACSSCSPHIPPQQATNINVGDGDLSFDIQVTTGQGPLTVGVYLASWKNSLSGDVGTFQTPGGNGGVPFVPMPAGPTGTLSVTKQAPGAASGGGTGGSGGGTPGGAP